MSPSFLELSEVSVNLLCELSRLSTHGCCQSCRWAHVLQNKLIIKAPLVFWLRNKSATADRPNCLFFRFSCRPGLGGPHGGRILTSVVVNWSRRKSRSSSSVSRLRDAVERFFSRRAWASSMSYSNMTFAFQGKKIYLSVMSSTDNSSLWKCSQTLWWKN